MAKTPEVVQACLNESRINDTGNPGSGDVGGPPSSTDEALARWDGVTGDLIQNSPILMDDAGNLTGVGFVNGNPLTYVDGTAALNVDRSPASAGVSPVASRVDHKHDVATAAPIAISDATNQEGVAASLARSDHEHAHGDRGGGTLHALATPLLSGFMSAADKDKLDATALLTDTVTPGLSGAEGGEIGSSLDAARADHDHPVSTVGVLTALDAGAGSDGTGDGLALKTHKHPLDTISGDLAQVDADSSANKGAALGLARLDHSHPTLVGPPTGELSGSTENAEGSSSALTRADHVHALDTSSGSVQEVSAESGAGFGSGPGLALIDHSHPVATGAPAGQLSADSENAEGDSPALARADHEHLLDVSSGSIQEVNAEDGASLGSGPGLALIDHTHPTATGAPSVPVSGDSVDAEGTGGALAKAGHSHSLDKSGSPADLSAASTSAQGAGPGVALAGHSHAIATGAGATIDAQTANTPGSGPGLSAEGHTHALAAGGTPTEVNAEDAASPGSSNVVALADHQHPVATAAPVGITDSTNSEGTSGALAKADHQHAHGQLSGDDLHALATAVLNGFMSASDKDKLDGIPEDATDFGADFQAAESIARETHTTSDYTLGLNPKVSLTVPSGRQGSYLIVWQAILDNDADLGDVRLRNITDGVSITGEFAKKSSNPSATLERLLVAGFGVVTFNLLPKTFEIQWRDRSGGNSQGLSDARIAIMRI